LKIVENIEDLVSV